MIEYGNEIGEDEVDSIERSDMHVLDNDAPTTCVIVFGLLLPSRSMLISAVHNLI
ncbi:hypothetical protein DPMN_010500 [Dreissena polymorpha]|uniref:Uncharacterized protein n=1 Tax=Dreissena polymorpha TaxID=45954 RepID=A0A9D4N012_DREPO|nr:hypothetical protein DPMN_010500 [Dreissena polymorpha]